MYVNLFTYLAMPQGNLSKNSVNIVAFESSVAPTVAPASRSFGPCADATCPTSCAVCRYFKLNQHFKNPTCQKTFLKKSFRDIQHVKSSAFGPDLDSKSTEASEQMCQAQAHKASKTRACLTTTTTTKLCI